MRNRTKSVLESIVIAAILLVLAQTFLEDFAVLIGWSWNIRKILLFTGFFFDLFFTGEFLARLYTSVYNGRSARYFFAERGWVDLLASIPLLLLSSGPAVLALLTGGAAVFALGGMLNVLKVVKAVRIARILRLLRVLKLFKQIKYTNSIMAQRHVAKITAMTVSLFVMLLFGGSLVVSMLGLPSVDQVIADRHSQTVERIVSEMPAESREARNWLAEMTDSSDLLLVKRDGTTLFSRFDNRYYTELFGPSDYQYIPREGYDFFFDMRTLGAIQSKDNLIFFVIIVVFVLFLLIYYSPHFALTVTDPIQVMRKGIEDDSYNLEVRIPGRYEDDDVYRLADAYNRVFLPMKDRSRGTTEARSSLLDFDDVKGLLDGE
ncbi:MAG: ion transporter [Spirochaetales bacterium]|nr:ion transporter [Spirochaetales bacterium]